MATISFTSFIFFTFILASGIITFILYPKFQYINHKVAYRNKAIISSCIIIIFILCKYLWVLVNIDQFSTSDYVASTIFLLELSDAILLAMCVAIFFDKKKIALRYLGNIAFLYSLYCLFCIVLFHNKYNNADMPQWTASYIFGGYGASAIFLTTLFNFCLGIWYSLSSKVYILKNFIYCIIIFSSYYLYVYIISKIFSIATYTSGIWATDYDLENGKLYLIKEVVNALCPSFYHWSMSLLFWIGVNYFTLFTYVVMFKYIQNIKPYSHIAQDALFEANILSKI